MMVAAEAFDVVSRVGVVTDETLTTSDLRRLICRASERETTFEALHVFLPPSHPFWKLPVVDREQLFPHGTVWHETKAIPNG